MAINNRQTREIGDIGYRRRKTKTIKAKNTTQYVLDTTIQKTQDKDKKTKKKKTTIPYVQQYMNFIQK
jgi:hypothetical protein